MMTERFWDLIRLSRDAMEPGRKGGNMDRQRDRLADLLRALPAEEVAAFDRVFRELKIRAYRWDLWGAAYVIEGGCSDDGFTDFRAWLISTGRDVYEKALADPESLVDAARGAEITSFEDFGYVARRVYEEKTKGRRMPDHGLDYPPDPAGKPWKEDEAELKRLYPKLFASFWKQRHP